MEWLARDPETGVILRRFDAPPDRDRAVLLAARLLGRFALRVQSAADFALECEEASAARRRARLNGEGLER